MHLGGYHDEVMHQQPIRIPKALFVPSITARSLYQLHGPHSL